LDAWAWFEPAEHGLVELPTRAWHGLVFVHAGEVRAPLEAHLDGLEGLVAPYEPEHLVVVADHASTVEANWKVVVENYQECYHCATIHPELCRMSPPRSGANDERTGPGAWVGAGRGCATGRRRCR